VLLKDKPARAVPLRRGRSSGGRSIGGCRARAVASGTTTQTGSDGWSSFDVTSWNVGFRADVYRQNGRSIPTITERAFATTTFNNVIELGYAFDKARGFLAGIQDTRAEVGNAFVRIHPNVVGYLDGYRRTNDWKFTGRIGVQHFGGADIFNRTPIPPFYRADCQARSRPDGRQ
jgi:hypothetical protein